MEPTTPRAPALEGRKAREIGGKRAYIEPVVSADAWRARGSDPRRRRRWHFASSKSIPLSAAALASYASSVAMISPLLASSRSRYMPAEPLKTCGVWKPHPPDYYLDDGHAWLDGSRGLCGACRRTDLTGLRRVPDGFAHAPRGIRTASGLSIPLRPSAPGRRGAYRSCAHCRDRVLHDVDPPHHRQSREPGFGRSRPVDDPRFAWTGRYASSRSALLRSHSRPIFAETPK